MKNLRVANVAHTSITVSWSVSSIGYFLYGKVHIIIMMINNYCIFQRHSFPRGTSSSNLQLRYSYQSTRGSQLSSTVTISSTQTQYTLSNLQFDQQYTISIQPRMRYSYCSSYIYGERSNEINVTTMETGTFSLQLSIHNSCE